MNNNDSVKIRTQSLLKQMPPSGQTQHASPLMDCGNMILKRYVHTCEDLYNSVSLPSPNNEISGSILSSPCGSYETVHSCRSCPHMQSKVRMWDTTLGWLNDTHNVKCSTYLYWSNKLFKHKWVWFLSPKRLIRKHEMMINPGCWNDVMIFTCVLIWLRCPSSLDQLSGARWTSWLYCHNL